MTSTERIEDLADATFDPYLADDLVFGTMDDPYAVLASAPPGYQLSVPDADCDVGRFRTAKAAGVRAAGEGQFEEASRHLSAALAEWHGSETLTH